MSRQLLHEVRDVLRAVDAIASEREFCKRWLGKSECYMRNRAETMKRYTMRSEWNEGTPIDADLQEFTDTLTNIENFRIWAARNPPVNALPDGRLMRQATEDEWIAKATADNASDHKMDTDSVMSGWVIKDTGTHVMQKVGKPTTYILPKTND